jgi:hypothetical protein
VSNVRTTILEKAKNVDRKIGDVLTELEAIVGPYGLEELEIVDDYPVNELSYRMDSIEDRCDAILERTRILKSFFVCEAESAACCVAEQKAS